MPSPRRTLLALTFAGGAALAVFTGAALLPSPAASGYNRTLPVYPAGVYGPRQLQARLARVTAWLRERTPATLTGDLRAARRRAIAGLEAYRAAGFFPINEQHPDRWAPAFIDSRGAICAVGYLIAQSDGRAAAERIDARFHDRTIEEIDDPALDRWIERSGLTRDEVIAIQEPGWRGAPLKGIEITGVALDTSSVRRVDTTRSATIAGSLVVRQDSNGVRHVRLQ
jgi:hypothetical protein